MFNLIAAMRCVAAIALAVTFAQAQAQPADAPEQAFEAAAQAAQAAAIAGPRDVPLKEQAVLKLPAGMQFIPQPAAGRLMQAMGNTSDDRLLGLVKSAGDSPWLVVARWEPAGYIKDDDAKDWNADELYAGLKDGTAEANKRRKELGFPELEIVGWVQKPAYDAATHRLVWSMAARTTGEQGQSQSVNYNTYALCREGYMTLNLITALPDIERDKPAAHTLLASLAYKDGKRYEDFNAGTDKVAAYGLAALVAGVAAKKLGLLAVVLAFAAKFAKVLLLGGAGVVAVLAKVFGRKDTRA